MPRVVIVAYRPKSGKEAELEKLVKSHTSVLKAEGLITDRKSIVMRSKNNNVIEVFEWTSARAIEDAHANEAVQVMWQKFSEICDYIPVSEVSECSDLFSEFTPLS